MPRRRADGPWIVELVGPAGAGKSTLAAALPGQHPEIATGPSLWGLPRDLLIASSIALLPTIFGAAASGHPFRRRELAQMIRIAALGRAIDRATPDASRTIVIDEGGVFGLTWLEVFYEATGESRRAQWRREERARWGARLAAVVRLDAEDDELAHRIRTREKAHAVKDAAGHEIEAFVARYRIMYDRVIADMSACGGMRVRTMPPTGAVADQAARLRSTIRESCYEG